MSLNQKGFSLVETIVAIGLAGVVSMGVVRLSTDSKTQTLYANQNFEMDNYIKKLAADLKDLDKCNMIIQKTATAASLNIGSFAYEPKFNLTPQAQLVPPTLTGVREVRPLTIYIRFDRGIQNDASKPTRKTIVLGQFTATGEFEGCANYETEAEKTAYRLSCEFIGGTFQERDGQDPPYDCDLSSISGNEEIYQVIKEYLCLNTLGGFDGGVSYYDAATEHCGRINLGATAPVSGANIGANNPGGFVRLRNTKRRATFTQSCPGTNEFIAQVTEGGTVNCKQVGFCVPGQNCPGDSGFVVGACGGSHDSSFAEAPSSNLCSRGTASTLSGNGPWFWSCAGAGGTVDCEAIKAVTSAAVCGNAHGSIRDSAPTSELCNPGQASSVTGTGPWDWSCTEASQSVDCRAISSTDAGVCEDNGYVMSDVGNATPTCNPASESNISQEDSLCCSGYKTVSSICNSTGTNVTTYCAPQIISDPDPDPDPEQCCFDERDACDSIHGSCSYYDNQYCGLACSAGLCGSSDGSRFASAPSSNLCENGVASALTGTGPWQWQCVSEVPGAASSDCSARKNEPITSPCELGVFLTQRSCEDEGFSVCEDIGPGWINDGFGNATGLCLGNDSDFMERSETCENFWCPTEIDGVCGSEEGTGSSQPNPANLCTSGIASAVMDGPLGWSWDCEGVAGGIDTSCTKNRPAVNCPAVNTPCIGNAPSGGYQGGVFRDRFTCTDQGNRRCMTPACEPIAPASCNLACFGRTDRPADNQCR